jgi:endogenous inhibitor of DNA gyrase (YacG/DUF329 family)
MSRPGRPIRCPLCGRATSWQDNPHRPFCSERCRLADLEGWLKGRYVVAGQPEEDATSPALADLTDEPSISEAGEKT